MRPSNSLDRGIFRAGQYAGAVHPGDCVSEPLLFMRPPFPQHPPPAATLQLT